MKKLRIDIVSDVMCPWCVIGYKGLNEALKQLEGELEADIHWQPFELNPNMSEQGQELGEHIAEKYGSTPEQSQQNRDHITQLGAKLGFEFNFTEGQRILNTFKAHQLLHWAGESSNLQTELKMALLTAYFTQGRDVHDDEVLAQIVGEVGLDADFARKLLADGVYAGDVRALQEQWRQMGVTAVPTFIIDEKYMISGGQPPEVFVQGLRQMIE
ncbi:MAG: DsbA family oxidoreductase [Oleispira antarctica]|nr:DsbA family oxidoreductase [Oleispira antarctica]MBQ0792275.1 DsbA family oxidoreductase [Oleispira antarctica]